jgi:hypothetical protein
MSAVATLVALNQARPFAHVSPELLSGNSGAIKAIWSFPGFTFIQGRTDVTLKL